MATNKNQHFVPRCHLRPFTVDEANFAINVYNLDRGKFISNAPVKTQCSGDYFYGKDPKLESAIQSLEGFYATTLNEVRSPGYVLADSHRGILRRFALFQYMRTEAASKRAVEVSAGWTRLFGERAEEFRLTIKEAVQMAMGTFVDVMDILDDLKVCLLRNRTEIPFVTSDNPAIVSNRWHLEDRRVRSKSFGFGAAGALLILPLSPRLACMGYDGDVYSIAHSGGWVDVKHPHDVEAINQHQFLNCAANIYLKDLDDSAAIEKQWLAAKPRRPKERYVVHYAVLDNREGQDERYKVINRLPTPEDGKALIHIQAVNYTPSSWPRFLGWKRQGVVYTNGTGVGYVRRERIDHYSERPYYSEPVGPIRA